MLSYRHAYHAGNHGDVLKHAVLIALLKYMARKGKPFWAIDTHAGAGAYALDSGQATKRMEYADGVGRLFGEGRLPPLLHDYVALVSDFNGRGVLRLYPGSPEIMSRLTGDDVTLRFFERHPTDLRMLQQRCAALGRRVRVGGDDGLAGLKALLPPPTRRALVLIDPSYEEKSDYHTVPAALADALARFAQGTYLVWYPRLPMGSARRLAERLRDTPAANWLDVRLDVRKPAKDGYGMHGSGLFIVNPPYTLPALLETAMPVLVERLGADAGAGYALDYRID